MANALDALIGAARVALDRVNRLLPDGAGVDWSGCRAATWQRSAFGGAMRAHPDVDDIDLDGLAGHRSPESGHRAEYAAVRAWVSSQQRVVVGCARHGQVVADPCIAESVRRPGACASSRSTNARLASCRRSSTRSGMRLIVSSSSATTCRSNRMTRRTKS